MNRKSKWVASLVAMGAFLGGCVAEDPEVAEVQSNAIVTNGIVLNAIVTNGIVSNHLQASHLADQAISSHLANGELLASPAGVALMEAPGGMELFSYIVSCALPDGVRISTALDGVAQEFHGAMGLAPDWETRGLTLSERRWVSACLLARVNAYGISVQISMRGPDVLAPTDAERAAFTVVEGAFYGNVFVNDSSELEMVACRGAGQAAGEHGGLVDRDCTEPAGNGLTQCGMKYAGDCLDFTPQSPSPRACATSLDGNYTSCMSQASLSPRPVLSTAEVVTVYVRP